MSFIVFTHAEITARRRQSCDRVWRRSVVEFTESPHDPRSSLAYVSGHVEVNGKQFAVTTPRSAVYKARKAAEEARATLEKHHPLSPVESTYQHCLYTQTANSKDNEHEHSIACYCSCGFKPAFVIM